MYQDELLRYPCAYSKQQQIYDIEPPVHYVMQISDVRHTEQAHIFCSDTETRSGYISLASMFSPYGGNRS